MASLDFQDATYRLAGFIEWLDADPESAAALNELRSRNVTPLLEAAGYNTPPKAKTPDDVAQWGWRSSNAR